MKNPKISWKTSKLKQKTQNSRKKLKVREDFPSPCLPSNVKKNAWVNPSLLHLTDIMKVGRKEVQTPVLSGKTQDGRVHGPYDPDCQQANVPKWIKHISIQYSCTMKLSTAMRMRWWLVILQGHGNFTVKVLKWFLSKGKARIIYLFLIMKKDLCLEGGFMDCVVIKWEW